MTGIKVIYVIILREIAHYAIWNGNTYTTSCGIITSTVPADAIDGSPHPNAVYCPECYPV